MWHTLVPPTPNPLAAGSIMGFETGTMMLAGALTLGHINDSGFWVTAKLPGLSLTGGLKTYTLAQSITGVFVLILALIGATLLPMGA
ncbi:hypothetical protein HGQ17_11950 [Nesterenkonia sp. MY13]|uniref:GntP family permease n=1 Tax=Nesterenkonia sedimenti TaxID=1463632 RepID=A0A7X8YET1_9MICC|nr:hypothetical protein [Nesterenkonia sedimenti]NLS10691.1 hypothetical protein [Nesterenkonia sedimenti]